MDEQYRKMNLHHSFSSSMKHGTKSSSLSIPNMFQYQQQQQKNDIAQQTIGSFSSLNSVDCLLDFVSRYEDVDLKTKQNQLSIPFTPSSPTQFLQTADQQQENDDCLTMHGKSETCSVPSFSNPTMMNKMHLFSGGVLTHELSDKGNQISDGCSPSLLFSEQKSPLSSQTEPTRHSGRPFLPSSPGHSILTKSSSEKNHLLSLFLM